MMQKCCCFHIRSGTIVLGWIGFMGSIISLISLPNMEADLEAKVSHLEDPETARSVIQTIVSASMAASIIQIIINSSMIYGAYKGKRFMLIPYLVTNALSLTAIAILVSALTVLGFNTSADAGFLALIFGSMYFGIVFYFWYAVYSLYHYFRLREGTGEGHSRLEDDNSYLTVVTVPTKATVTVGDNPPPYNTLKV